jgi:hypothetical protein
MAVKETPKEMLLDGAQMSLSAFIAGTMGFLKQHNIPIKDWVSSIGEQFEGSLGALEGDPVGKVMQHLLSLEILPLGAEVLSSHSTAETAEVEVTLIPSKALLGKFGTTPRELLRGFGVTQREFESILDMFEPAARAIGLKFRHHASDGNESLTLERARKPRSRRTT